MKKTLTFDQRCHSLLAQIPKGRVSTYRELAHALGSKAYRAVGQAMNRNPNLMKVPCHRVIKSNGEIGGYALGADKKKGIAFGGRDSGGDEWTDPSIQIPSPYST